MIYFSDLDRTIICSKKLITKEDNAICIESIDGEDISFISNEILNSLKILNLEKVFIPTTTRSVQQFKRIEFNKFGLDFKYAITSNGACILKDGIPLESWKKEINKIKSNSTSMDEIINKYENDFEKYIAEYIQKFRVVEDNFFYFVLKKEFVQNIEFLNDFIEYTSSNGWDYYKNCSKVYFLPKGMTKENAVKFLIKNELNTETISALGDSCMDAGMLSIANKAYVPKHGDISSTFKHDNLYVSNEIGLKGIHEILKTILED